VLRQTLFGLERGSNEVKYTPIVHGAVPVLDSIAKTIKKQSKNNQNNQKYPRNNPNCQKETANITNKS
jgi:hypothetical protein